MRQGCFNCGNAAHSGPCPYEKPHLRLHLTRKGDWWVSLHHPLDKGYTLKSTSNYMDSGNAVMASKWLLSSWRGHRAPRHMGLQTDNLLSATR